MIEKIKATISICLILLLFPYVVVMLSGRQAEKMPVSEKEAMDEALENLVLEILPGQMAVTYELEALKAQAVIIRSNLVYRMETEGVTSKEINTDMLDAWDLVHYSSVELEEIWGNELFEGYYEKIHKAVQETCGKVLTYQGQYVDLPYHAVSAGKTRDGSLLGENYPYLKAVDCPGDLEAEGFLKIQQMEFMEIPEITKRDHSDYVTEIRLGETLMAGEEFRRIRNLNSSCFTIQEQNGYYTVTTKGLGHGFGLSMYQAHLQASQGKTFLEILQYFYEGMECISFS